MSNKNPQAFPTSSFNPGMSLRDYFAGMALSGISGNTTILNEAKDCGDVANAAYNFADAMLAERMKE